MSFTTRPFVTSQLSSAAARTAITTGAAPISSATFVGPVATPGVLQIDPGVIGLLGGGLRFPPIPFPIPTPTPTPTPSPTPGPSADLQAILSSVPIAQDGQLISSAHHNTLREALIAVAAHLGAGGGGGVQFTQTVAPAFYAMVTVTPPAAPVALPPWVMTPGVAMAPSPAAGTTVTDAGGWIPVRLADGAHIQSLHVLGSRTGTMASLEFDLLRIPYDAHQVPVLIKVTGDTSTDPFAQPVQYDPAGQTSAVIQEATTVDNTKYQYAISAIGRGIASGAAILIRGFQITCTLG